VSKLWRSLRIKSTLVLVVTVVVGGCSGPPQQQPLSQSASAKQAPAATKHRIPSPLFSQAYAEALSDVLALETEDVQKLEQRLTENPDDFAARLKLIAYAMRADRAGLEESRRSRTDLVSWLVENRPDSEIHRSPYSMLQRGQLTPEQLERAMRLWDSVAKARPSDARVMWNAANFYRTIDDSLHRAFLERAVALAPGNENYTLELGGLYASAILRNGYSMYAARGTADPDLARHAAEVLDTTSNALLLEPAVRLLQNQYNRSLMMGKENVALGGACPTVFSQGQGA
jgi:Flp pilus assembly protein TadD